MNKNKKLGIVAWILGLVLTNVLLFCLSRELTPTFWITFGFAWLAFLSVLIFQLLVWKQIADSDTKVLHITALSVSYIYIVIQIPLCLVFAIGSGVIPWKAALLIQAVLMILAWLVIIGSLTGNDHVQKVNAENPNGTTTYRNYTR